MDGAPVWPPLRMSGTPRSPLQMTDGPAQSVIQTAIQTAAEIY